MTDTTLDDHARLEHLERELERNRISRDGWALFGFALAALEEVGVRIADALRSREVIARAQGVLMERSGVTEDEAASVLHRASRDADVSVRQHAADVVASTRRDNNTQDVPRGG